MKKDQAQIMSTKETEGVERPAVLVLIPTAVGNFSYLCYAWGFLNGQPFCDTIDGNHIEFYGPIPYVVQCPKPGHTFELNGDTRELKSESPKLVVM